MGGIVLELSTFIGKLPQSEIIRLADQIAYVPEQKMSMALVQRPDLVITLFAVDCGQQIRRHVTSGDAFVQVLDGAATIEIGEERYLVRAGESIVMPAYIPHALEAVESSFKMLLVVVKATAGKRELA